MYRYHIYSWLLLLVPVGRVWIARQPNENIHTFCHRLIKSNCTAARHELMVQWPKFWPRQDRDTSSNLSCTTSSRGRPRYIFCCVFLLCHQLRSILQLYAAVSAIFSSCIQKIASCRPYRCIQLQL